MKLSRVSAADVCIHIFLMIVVLIMLLPLYNVLLISFATPAKIAKQIVYLWPTSFDITAYSYIFSDSQIWKSLNVSLFVTVVGTLINIVATTFGAYALTKKQMPGRNIFLVLILISMLFNGGMIPTYLLIKNMHLMNNLFSMILPLAVNTFYLIIMMNFFRTVPDALEESAKIDGANDIQILLRIILPISMPTVAAITLFYAVDRWNEWWSAFLYLQDTTKFPMQLYLREMLVDVNKIMNSSFASSFVSRKSDLYPQGVKMATVIVTILPVMLVYPFLQRHFSSGVMIGAVKE
ncbi:putative aldouronate transport system permease protein [Paenibacillus castaneae]|uniref:carbohydrate ABC transporter permease n=1 Tax=Paenibacillus castaneae TaxID=474957 RepID=UPI000C9B0907|nr:carbohydrate ABC transporter permease [Paenibacillus castaneae]NIK78719.1 putative aldouronate transport system permease protein [Paenibacillus castaneae]